MLPSLSPYEGDLALCCDTGSKDYFDIFDNTPVLPTGWTPQVAHYGQGRARDGV
jgi:hypothetical protein